jgi:predicted nucleotidyltransferase
MDQILSTLAHYEAERGVPLSAFEVYKYLHKNSNTLSFKEILNELKELKKKKNIKEKNGFYYLNSSENKKHYSQRIKRDKISIKKWKKARKIICLMQTIPFVKSVSVAGSLSMNNTSEKSDIDLFITTKYGRIWTVRTFSMLLMQIFGQRRHDKKINNKICLNYYVTETSLPKIQNLASANVFLRTVPVLNKKEYGEFFKKNTFWIEKYFQKAQEKFQIKNLRSIKKNRLFLFIKNLLEFLLSGKIGDFIEKHLAFWQKNRIQKKIKKEQSVTNLIFTDEILMFHWPKPRNSEVMEKYKKTVNGIHIKTGDC